MLLFVCMVLEMLLPRMFPLLSASAISVGMSDSEPDFLGGILPPVTLFGDYLGVDLDVFCDDFKGKTI